MSQAGRIQEERGQSEQSGGNRAMQPRAVIGIGCLRGSRAAGHAGGWDFCPHWLAQNTRTSRWFGITRVYAHPEEERGRAQYTTLRAGGAKRAASCNISVFLCRQSS